MSRLMFSPRPAVLLVLTSCLAWSTALAEPPAVYLAEGVPIVPPPTCPSGVDACGVCGGLDKEKGCDGVCWSGKVKDACGVCGGLDKEKGCDGVCWSGKVKDACGVCGGLDKEKGCDGVCWSGKVKDACGVCGGLDKEKGCDGICWSGKVKDACGVCGGLDKEKGCDGVCWSGKVKDACGVCGGLDKEKGCDGVCWSGKVKDACGVCGGLDKEKGCDGVCWSGKVKDACGVCGGLDKEKGCDGVCWSGTTDLGCGCGVPGPGPCGCSACVPPPPPAPAPACIWVAEGATLPSSLIDYHSFTFAELRDVPSCFQNHFDPLCQDYVSEIVGAHPEYGAIYGKISPEAGVVEYRGCPYEANIGYFLGIITSPPVQNYYLYYMDENCHFVEPSANTKLCGFVSITESPISLIWEEGALP